MGVVILFDMLPEEVLHPSMCILKYSKESFQGIMEEARNLLLLILQIGARGPPRPPTPGQGIRQKNKNSRSLQKSSREVSKGSQGTKRKQKGCGCHNRKFTNQQQECHRWKRMGMRKKNVSSCQGYLARPIRN